jgi:hypothetical protein
MFRRILLSALQCENPEQKAQKNIRRPELSGSNATTPQKVPAEVPANLIGKE